ncbi:deoxynucleoside kinase [Thauera sp. AutoDN2]|jgi:deoxyadenosine/deoxycytidine kinase|uniref:deoxynucleoside kinase n=1 Tax=Thauera sp. AutoDN2 TaxID=3416051 RepID=UPI002A406439|nr:deoxynucleoside kinase [Thauera sp.]
MLDKARYIVVEGPIGAGKTSLAKRLAERLQAETLLEQAERNPFLGRFYQQPERWGMATQLSFLFQRIDQLAGLGPIEGERRVVADFLFDKDRLFAEQNLAESELALYQRVHDTLQPVNAPRPDLVIYLQARPDTLLGRIHKRGLEAERRITETYLHQVAERYTRYFYQYDAAPLFIVDNDRLNPVDRDEDFEMLLERLREMRSYREFFGYAD